MKKYLVTGPAVSFHTGAVLTLTDPQAAARSYALKPLKKGGLYEVTGSTVQFKRGEEIGLDGPLSKAALELLRPVNAADKKADSGKAAEAPASDQQAETHSA